MDRHMDRERRGKERVGKNWERGEEGEGKRKRQGETSVFHKITL